MMCNNDMTKSTNQQVIIRPASTDDLHEMALLQHAWEHEQITHGQTATDLPHLQEQINEYALVAQTGNQLVGIVMASVHVSEGMAVIPAGERYLEIDDLYVMPEWRAQDIGHQLLDTVLARAEADGIHYQLVYTATKEIRRILRFYESCGFESWYVQMYRRSPESNMETLALVEPSLRFAEAFIAMNHDQIEHDIRFQGFLPVTEDAVAVEVANWQRREEVGDDWTGGISTSHYWLVRNGKEVIGSCSLRHYLDEPHCAIGHVDYGITFSERGKGYGSRQLALLLEKARERGMRQVVVAISPENIASRRVAEKNGGILSGELPHPRLGVPIVQYLFVLDRPSVGDEATNG